MLVLAVLVHSAELHLAPVEVKAIVFNGDGAKTRSLRYRVAELTSAS